MSRNLVQLRRHRTDALDNALQRLKAVMHEKREITHDDIAAIARATTQPEAMVYGVATYYGDLGLQKKGRTRVKVCKGTACFAADAGEGQSLKWFEKYLQIKEGQITDDGAFSLEAVYCLGECHSGHAAEIEGVVISGLTEEKVAKLVEQLRNEANSSAVTDSLDQSGAPRFEAHGCKPIILERLSVPVDATQLDVALKHHVFSGLKKVLDEKVSPESVLSEVEASGLRGRGGAGFATATKWRFAAQYSGSAGQAYVVCNADEGDPGSYIDRYIMERDPFAVLEGMALAGYAIGANQGYIYVRSEYPASAPQLRQAIEQAKKAGWLGEKIQGSDFSFSIEVVEGAGSYVCGEETALLRSIEGLRGMVTARPPFPAEKGLFDKPTVVNNVETLANLGWICRHGGKQYGAIGVGKSRGTKTVSLNERFVRPGIYEVPLGMTLRTILVDIAGGLKDNRPIKAVQVGGPLGGILPEKLLDTPLGFEELDAVGALLGHGGIVAWDDRVDVRDIAIHLFEFCDAESCGKCFPCRIGGRRGLEIVKRLKENRSNDEIVADSELLTELCETMKLGSLCAHGGAIPIPIASLMVHFRDEMTGRAQ